MQRWVLFLYRLMISYTHNTDAFIINPSNHLSHLFAVCGFLLSDFIPSLRFCCLYFSYPVHCLILNCYCPISVHCQFTYYTVCITIVLAQSRKGSLQSVALVSGRYFSFFDSCGWQGLTQIPVWTHVRETNSGCSPG